MYMALFTFIVVQSLHYSVIICDNGTSYVELSLMWLLWAMQSYTSKWAEIDIMSLVIITEGIVAHYMLIALPLSIFHY